MVAMAREIFSARPGSERNKAADSSLDKIDGISSLRGLAAFYVFLFHITLIAVPVLTPPVALQSIILRGGSGVSLFFIISAYTLALSMSKRNWGATEILGFYVRRFFRIAPLFWLMLFGMIVYRMSNHMYFEWHIILANLFFVFNVVPVLSQGIVDASWTIGLEMVFYIFFPFLFKCTKSIFCAVKFLAVSFVLSFVINSNVFLLHAEVFDRQYVYMSLANHLPFFMIGLLCFKIHEKYGDRFKSEATGWMLLLLSFFGFVLLWRDGRNFVGEEFYSVGVNYGILLIACLVGNPGVVVNRITAFYGKISFSFYLMHPVIIFVLLPVFLRIHEFKLSSGLDWFLCVATATPIVTGCAWVGHALIESNGMRLGKKIVDKYLYWQSLIQKCWQI